MMVLNFVAKVSLLISEERYLQVECDFNLEFFARNKMNVLSVIAAVDRANYNSKFFISNYAGTFS